MPLLNNSEIAYNLGMYATAQLIKQQKLLMCQSFEYKDLKFVFRVPYKLDYVFDGEYFVHENDELDIVVRAENFEKFLESFYEFMYVLWTEYAQAKDESLHTDAIEFKRLLLNMCEVTK